MNNGSLGSVANWMDAVRGQPEGAGMDSWHYESLQVCDGTRDCTGDDCAGPRIRQAIETLRSGQGNQLKALRVLVHLVGDVHQPLHAAENRDRGGNFVRIINRSCLTKDGKVERCKLHTYWDNNLVKDALGQRTEQAFVDELVKMPIAGGGTVDDWIRESNRLAKEKVHAYAGFACNIGKNEVKVDKDYDNASARIVAEQLAAAGNRLAAVLNDIYKP